jgi:hypothetical protein
MRFYQSKLMHQKLSSLARKPQLIRRWYRFSSSWRARLIVNLSDLHMQLTSILSWVLGLNILMQA